MVRKLSIAKGGSLASDRVMSNLNTTPCNTHLNVSSPKVAGDPANLNLYQIHSGGSLASDAVMKGLENPPCSYSLAFEGTERQTGGKRHSRKTKTKTKQSGGKSRKTKTGKTKSRQTKSKQTGGKHSRKSSKKSTKKYKKSHRGGGSDWGHTLYSRVVGGSDATEASNFKHFTNAEFEAPSKLAKDAGLSSPSNGVLPYDPLGNSHGSVGN